MTKYFLILSGLFLSYTTTAQTNTMFMYPDFNGFVRGFINGNFMQIEAQECSQITATNNFIAYQNAQRDLKYHNGIATKILTNQLVTFRASDNFLAYNLGQQIYYYENGIGHNVTLFGGQYVVSDSLIAYQDQRYMTLNTIWKGESIILTQQTGTQWMPELVSDNMLVYKDNANNYQLFYQGKTFEIGPYNNFQAYKFAAGKDIMAFNDPVSQTFVVFDKGEFIELESMHTLKFKCGWGFVIYEDNQHNLKIYKDGEVQTISSFFDYWDVQDNCFLWGESNSVYTYEKGEKTQILNYPIKQWIMKNDIIAYRTNIGGVGARINGVSKEITNLTRNEFSVNGEGVMVYFENKSALVYWNGKIYQD